MDKFIWILLPGFIFWNFYKIENLKVVNKSDWVIQMKTNRGDIAL